MINITVDALSYSVSDFVTPHELPSKCVFGFLRKNSMISKYQENINTILVKDLNCNLTEKCPYTDFCLTFVCEIMYTLYFLVTGVDNDTYLKAIQIPAYLYRKK